MFSMFEFWFYMICAITVPRRTVRRGFHSREVMVLMDLGVVWMPQGLTTWAGVVDRSIGIKSPPRVKPGIVHLDVWKLLSPQLSVTIFAAPAAAAP